VLYSQSVLSLKHVRLNLQIFHRPSFFLRNAFFASPTKLSLEKIDLALQYVQKLFVLFQLHTLKVTGVDYRTETSADGTEWQFCGNKTAISNPAQAFSVQKARMGCLGLGLVC